MSRSSYFDNAATTYPKPEVVYQEADRVFRTMGGSIGRGDGEHAKTASALMQDSKNAVKRLSAMRGQRRSCIRHLPQTRLTGYCWDLNLEGATVYVFALRT